MLVLRRILVVGDTLINLTVVFYGLRMKETLVLRMVKGISGLSGVNAEGHLVMPYGVVFLLEIGINRGTI